MEHFKLKPCGPKETAAAIEYSTLKNGELFIRLKPGYTYKGKRDTILTSSNAIEHFNKNVLKRRPNNGIS